MPTVAIKTQGGGTAGDITLSDRVFGAPRNIALIHQAVKAELENRRQGTKQTKGRSDIDAGGKKPYKQKGTGRARQGSTVAPQFRHGGKALHFIPRDMGHALPKKMRRGAIRAALSAKLADGELIVVDGLPVAETPSTKAAVEFLAGVGVTLGKKTLVVLPSHDEVAIKSLRNIDNLTLRVAPAFSTRDVVDGGLVVLTRGAVEKVEELLGDSAAVAAEGEAVNA
jgi:large subunit ribosomal protein L4